MPKPSRFVLLLSAMLLITPWLATYAYGANAAGWQEVQIETATPPTLPRATFFGRAIGSIAPGELFYIDAINHQSDITATLYLSDTYELTQYLRYLTLKVGVYVEGDDGQWQKAPSPNGQPTPDALLTLYNSTIRFSLPGAARYKVTIDAGSFYCTAASGENHAPQFYITVEPA